MIGIHEQLVAAFMQTIKPVGSLDSASPACRLYCEMNSAVADATTVV